MTTRSGDPIVIVGAGMAGLSAARLLHEAGEEVIVLDKGLGVGGRMATRRIGSGRFDHGAQFFTAREPEFQAQVARWVADGTAVPWAQGFADGTGGAVEDGHPRYAGAVGMAGVAKSLAQGLDVRLGEWVTAVRYAPMHWQLFTAERPELPLRAGALILTPPMPQTLALLDAGQTSTGKFMRAHLESITFAPCLALLVLLEGPSQVPAPGGLQLMSEPVFWIGDNTQKGISPGASALTIHGGPEFSAANWAAKDEEVAEQLLHAAEPWLGTAVLEWQVKRWRYSLPLTPVAERFSLLPGPAPLLFAGDAFGGPRVEGAVLSGLAAARELLTLLS